MIILHFSHQVCCLLCYLGKINSGIHMYQFTLNPLTLLFLDVVVDSDLYKNVWRQKGMYQQICIPLFTPFIKVLYLQDCAIEASRCHRPQTFAFGRLKKLTFS